MINSGSSSGPGLERNSKIILEEKSLGILNELSELTDTLREVLEPRLSLQVFKRSLSNLLCRDCVLVDLSSSAFDEEDVKSSLIRCASLIGSKLFLIESRLLTLSQSKLQALSLYVPQQGSCTHMPYLSAALLSPPCILYIDNLDALVESHAPSGALVVSESPEEIFFTTLNKFLKDVCGLYEDTGGGGAGVESIKGGVVIVASSANLSSLRPRTLSLFPLVIPCPVTPSLDYIVDSVGCSPAYSSSVAIAPAAKGDLLRWLRKHNTFSPRLVAEVWGALEGEVLARVRGEDWLRDVGWDIQPTPSLSDSAAPLSLHPQDISNWACKGQYAVGGVKGGGGGGGKAAAKGVGGVDVAPVTWSQVGGLEGVKKELRDLLDLPLAHPHLFPPQAPRRRGVLLYGPPGTGKTLVAKALATESGRAFLSVKGPELLDSYVGESEGNVRKIFAQASALAPSLLFLDEIDALAPRRSSNGAGGGGGVMDRMVAQILGEMDRAHEGVVVVGATNRPDLLDPALLRGGRLDRAVYMGGLTGEKDKMEVLAAQLRGLVLSKDVELMEVAKCLPEGVTGAQIGGVTSRAVMRAIHKKIDQLKHQANNFFHTSSLSTERGKEIAVNGMTKSTRESDSLGEAYEDIKLKQYLSSLSDDDLVVEIDMQDLIEEAGQVVPPAYSSGMYDWRKVEHEAK